MKGCEFIFASPDRPNIYYEVRKRTTIDVDFEPLVHSLVSDRNKAPRVVVYCRSLNMVADLYAHFVFSLGNKSYYPQGAETVSENRLFGMYHANTSPHNKDIIQKSMLIADGKVRIVFATVALGMGENMVDVNTIWHYGAPSTLDDYLQESGRAGCSGNQATSIVFWKPVDAPLCKDCSSSLNEHLSYKRGVAGPKMATGSNYFKKL